MKTQHLVGKMFQYFYDDNIIRATKYIDEKTVLRLTRRQYKYGKSKAIELVVTLTRPNFVERNFIEKCIKAGEPFPVKKIQLKFKKK